MGWRLSKSKRPDLVFAWRDCLCGLPMAYDRRDKVMADPFKGYWDCSGIILGTADDKVKHEAQLPFIFWELKVRSDAP